MSCRIVESLSEPGAEIWASFSSRPSSVGFAVNSRRSCHDRR